MYASSCTIGSEFNRHLQPVVRMKSESAPRRCDAPACNATGTHCLCGELIEAIDDHFKSNTMCSASIELWRHVRNPTEKDVWSMHPTVGALCPKRAWYSDFAIHGTRRKKLAEALTCKAAGGDQVAGWNGRSIVGR